jgi:Sulfotransferase family
MRPLFIGGCERSGTTMLGTMLGCHSQCLCVPESQFLDALLAGGSAKKPAADPRRTLARIAADERYRLFWALPIDPETGNDRELSTPAGALSWLVRAYGRRVGRESPALWVDHTPTNFRRGRTLLRMFPEARFIHLVRDGRAVAASLLPLDWGPNNSLQAAEFWMARCASGLAAELELGTERVLRVRYEDVLTEPEITLRRIASFAGLDYEPAMAAGGGSRPSRYHEQQHRLVGEAPDPTRIEEWRQVLSSRDIEIFEAEAAEFLEALGYASTFGLSARPATRAEVLGLRLRDLGRRVRNNLHRRWRARRSLTPS